MLAELRALRLKRSRPHNPGKDTAHPSPPLATGQGPMELSAALPCAPAALLALWLLGCSMFSSFATRCRKLRLRGAPADAF
jgi:hypothetical protein